MLQTVESHRGARIIKASPLTVNWEDVSAAKERSRLKYTSVHSFCKTIDLGTYCLTCLPVTSAGSMQSWL